MAPASLDVNGTVDFPSIARYFQMYRVMRYNTLDNTRAIVGPQYDHFDLINLPATKNVYMLGVLDGARRQEIIIRGTANFRNALSDINFEPERDAKLKIELHEGFASMARAVYTDVLPRLRKDYSVAIFGHSLGAAEAVILGMLLSVDGFDVTQIYASGQPRVTNAEGAMKYGSLPILRIVDEADPVPNLPPMTLPSASNHYVHFGTELYLLDGPYYSLVGRDTGDDALSNDVWRALTKAGEDTPIRNHYMTGYITHLTPKLTSAIQVPYADRAKYIASPLVIDSPRAGK